MQSAGAPSLSWLREFNIDYLLSQVAGLRWEESDFESEIELPNFDIKFTFQWPSLQWLLDKHKFAKEECGHIH